MLEPTTEKPITVLDHLIDFAGTQESWNADALRRIVEKGGWTQADVEELCKLRKAEALDPDFSYDVYVPLSRTPSLPVSSGDNTSSLVCVCHIAGVNRLPQNQLLPFSPSGITVIYGNNGSGKSGYARILKSACKCRGGAPSIEGDIALPDPPQAQAKITIRTGEKEEILVWNGDSTLDDPRLRSMFVFDSAVAESYISAEEAAHFVPFGLQLPRQLTHLLDEVKKALVKEISDAQAENDRRHAELKIDEETEAGKLIKSSNLDKRKLDQLANVGEEEKRQLRELRNLLETEDIQSIITTRQNYDQRLKAFRNTYGTIFQRTCAEAQKVVFDCVLSFKSAKAAADGARQALAGSALLPGTAKEDWQVLWRAAERFSLIGAYPGKPYPYLEDDARCVLCQQPMTKETAERMRVLAQSVAMKHEALLKSASERVDALLKEYRAEANLFDELEKVDTILAELLPREKTESIRKACLALDSLIVVLKEALSRREPAQIIAQPAEDAKAMIDTAIVRNEDRLKQATASTDPEKAVELRAMVTELEARIRLGEVKPFVSEYFDSLQKINKLTAMKNRISTTEISRKEKELTAQFVTEKFMADFRDEVNRISISTIKPKLATRTSKAETKFKIALEENSRSISVEKIASEGEQRAIALACFLAELGQSTDKSTLIFDDPVSSLDHYNRKRIAKRLAEEAADGRQVIIFTHDAIFLQAIHHATKAGGIPCSCGRLDWKDNRPGHYFPDLPWASSRVSVRIDDLEKKLGQIKRNSQTSQEDKESISRWYGLLRSTIERIVEERLFNGCVNRFEEYIEIGRLTKCKCIDPADIDELQRLFGIASRLIDAHDPSLANCADSPSCDEMRDHLEATRRLVESIKVKQRMAN